MAFRQHQPGGINAGGLDDPGAEIARKQHHLLQQLDVLNLPVTAPLSLDDANRFLVTEFVVGHPFVDPQADLACARVGLLCRHRRGAIEPVTHYVICV